MPTDSVLHAGCCGRRSSGKLASGPPSATSYCAAASPHIGAAAFIHRFGSSLNGRCDAKEMMAYRHSGFSVDTDVGIEAHDRAALERMLRRIAFVTEGAQIRKILDHIGADREPRHLSSARGPLRWDDFAAQMGGGVEVEPDWARRQLAASYDLPPLYRVNTKTRARRPP